VERIRQLRTYGWTRPQYAEVSNGRCSRLDELQAAILAVKLDALDEQIERRRGIANLYNAAFATVPIQRPIERDGFRHVYNLYVVRSRERDALEKHLKCLGIMTGRHYSFPVHEQPGLAADARIPCPLVVTEKIKAEILTLPLYPSMSMPDQVRVIEGVCSFFK
jgi:dTDP-4-amino-4,6-dideoxygalactose transaminase